MDRVKIRLKWPWGALGEHPSLNQKMLEKLWDCDEDEKK